MQEGDGSSAKTLRKSRFHFQNNWSGNGLGRPVLTNGKRPNKILRRERDFLNMQAREPASFCRENVVAIVILLRVFARMSWWRKQDIKC